MSTDKRREGKDGAIEIMGAPGDTKHYWNKKNWKDVQAAKEVFDLYVKRGYKAYLLRKDGEPGEPMDDFDPSAGGAVFTSVLLVPQMAGG